MKPLHTERPIQTVALGPTLFCMGDTLVRSASQKPPRVLGAGKIGEASNGQSQPAQ